MLVSNILFISFCTIAGGAVSAGYVAFITLLGVFEKLAEKYKASKYRYTIETFMILGVTFGNLFQILQISIPYGTMGFIIYNLMGGIFTGCLAGALAETLDVFPILSRRLNIRKHFPYILVAAALGKILGCIIQFFYFG